MEFQIFQIIILIASAIVHEYMHGFVADRLGDPTARVSGRLTLNPLPHIDLWGSIVVPLLLILSNVGFVFGWAKPVPFNPNNLKDKKYGPAKVAAAGPLGNLILAVAFGLILRLGIFQAGAMIELLAIIVYINLILMVFNLVPIPPLDGSRILSAFLPYSWQKRFDELENYGMILVFLFVFFAFSIISPIIGFLFSLLTGIPTN